MTDSDHRRYSQTLANFTRTVTALQESVAAPIVRRRDLSGVIKDFELAYELSWKALKMFLALQGHSTNSARSVFKEAFSLGYIDTESVWIAMIEDRNQTVRTYNEAFARAMVQRIAAKYVQTLADLSHRLNQFAQNEP